LVIPCRTYYNGAKSGEGGAAGNGADRQSIDGEVAAIDGPLTPRGMTVGGLVLTVILRFERKLCAVMFRIVAVALVAMAGFDWYYLDGKHLHAVEQAALSFLHFVVR
jgi:hypothetical protein